MFIAIYRWKLKAGLEARFQEGWQRRTRELVRKGGSLGSRLHRAEDGTWAAYAQWPDRATREAAGELPVDDPEARVMMRESIEESYPDLYLEVVIDLLSPGTLGQGTKEA
jgi:hypothetical protein